jgi:hypothetical protein
MVHSDALASMKVLAWENSFLLLLISVRNLSFNRYDKPRSEGFGYLTPPRQLRRRLRVFMTQG